MSAEADNRREYFRIATTLRVRARPLVAGRRSQLESQILTRSRARSDLDPQLLERLERLESRLDLLLEHFGLGEGPPFREQDVQHVLLSGSGIRMADPGDAAPGQEWIVDLEIPETPPRAIRALATVVKTRLSDAEAPGDVALRFSVIHEDDRDAVVAHCLAVERRGRRAERDASS